MNILIIFILLILITVFVIGGGIYTTNKDKFDPTKSLFENMLSVLTPPKDDSEVQSDESVGGEGFEASYACQTREQLDPGGAGTGGRR